MQVKFIFWQFFSHTVLVPFLYVDGDECYVAAPYPGLVEDDPVPGLSIDYSALPDFTGSTLSHRGMNATT